MSIKNCTRSGCKDVFHAFLVKNARFDTELEIPCIKPENKIPLKLIPFSKSVGGTDHSCFVHFYEDDAGKFMVAMAEAGEKVDVVFMDPPRTGSDTRF